MAEALRPRLPPNVSLVEQDFLDFDLLAAAGRDLRVVGNLPYNVSSPIIFKLLRARRDGGRLMDATLMVQREVAERIEGTPGTKNYGTLAIFVQLRATVRRLLTLAARGLQAGARRSIRRCSGSSSAIRPWT